jgi:hypothetical protein
LGEMLCPQIDPPFQIMISSGGIVHVVVIVLSPIYLRDGFFLSAIFHNHYFMLSNPISISCGHLLDINKIILSYLNLYSQVKFMFT